MGFSSLIDLIGSTIIGGYVILMLLGFNESSVENSANYNEELILQQNLSTVAQVIEYDFRKIGYCKDWKKIPEPSKAVLFADSSQIKFLTDVDMNGVLDTMYYYLGSTDELSYTANPYDRKLYRVINSEPAVGANLGVTEFKIVYLNSSNDTLSVPVVNPGEIASMEVNIAVQKTESYGDVDKENKYSGAFWRQIRLVARNLRNR